MHARRWHQVPMLALTFCTGVVDAVSFLGLDRVFTGNMTGNVAILGMALTGVEGLSVIGSLAALLGFLAGTAVGGRTLRVSPPGWNARVTLLLGIVTTLLVCVAVALLLLGGAAGPPRVTLVTAVLGLAMGLQAAAARFVAVTDVTTVAVTATLIGLGFDSPLGADRSGRRRRQALAVMLILTGAAVGALLVRGHPAAGIGLAAAVAAGATCLGARWSTRPAAA